MMYSVEYDMCNNLYQIRISNPESIENRVDILARICEETFPNCFGEELAEHIKNFKPLTREDRLARAIDKEDTRLLKELFIDSTFISAVYSSNITLIFKYLDPEEVRFLFKFGLIYDYDMGIKRRNDTEEIFEVTLEKIINNKMEEY